MLKVICPGLILLLALAVPGLTVPAWAETPSGDCLSAIKAADAHHRADKVPADCWRMGPLHLGMTSAQLHTLLGSPDASRTLDLPYRGRKYPVMQLRYVYPRNLKNWLRLAPERLADFRPVILTMSFFKNALAAVNVGDTHRAEVPACKPSIQSRGFFRKGADFPYGFHGLTLGAPIASVAAHFGRFSSINNSHDFRNYWPVPLSVDGGDVVSAIAFATGMAFTGGSGLPDFKLKLDSASCLVTGYTLAQ